jgi:hypothetical protein
VDLEVRVLVEGGDGEGGVACAGADFEEEGGRGGGGGQRVYDGKFLGEPFAVFEKVSAVVGVEEVPPFGGVVVEAGWSRVVN